MTGSTREKLKAWREAMELSQEALAEMVGCSQQAISNVESGKRSPWLSLALDLERVSKGKIPARMWPSKRNGKAA